MDVGLISKYTKKSGKVRQINLLYAFEEHPSQILPPWNKN